MTRHRAIRVIGACGIVALLASGACRQSRTATPAETQRFEIAIGSPEQGEEFRVPRTSPNGDSVFVSPQVLVTEEDIAGVEPSQLEGGGAAIKLVLTEQAAKRVTARSSEYVDKMMVFLWDDRVIAAPYVRTPLGRLLMFGVSDSLSEKELNAIADYLRDRSHHAVD